MGLTKQSKTEQNITKNQKTKTHPNNTIVVYQFLSPTSYNILILYFYKYIPLSP